MRFIQLVLAGVVATSVSMSALASNTNQDIKKTITPVTNTASQSTTKTVDAGDQSVQLSDEQKFAMGVCRIVSDGIFNIAVMHQTGVSKDEAIKNITTISQNLVKEFGDDEISQYIRKFWQGVLTSIYEQKIQETEEDKRGFVQGATQEAARICMNTVLNAQNDKKIVKK